MTYQQTLKAFLNEKIRINGAAFTDVAGASPSGTFRVQLASETAGTNVIMKAGSFIRYRTY